MPGVEQELGGAGIFELPAQRLESPPESIRGIQGGVYVQFTTTPIMLQLQDPPDQQPI
jgi:hypothetical protein